MDNYVLGFVMAGGRGSRLKILTKHRTKPAVTIAGHYRIFDFVVTNIARSQIPTMIIAAQFKPRSLIKHVSNGRIWGFDEIDRRVEVTHPHERKGEIVKFEGTADSVRKNLSLINRYDPRIVLVLGGDHVYSMDYRNVVRHHTLNNADVTIMASTVSRKEVSEYGIIKVDETGKILDFAEKPESEEKIEDFRLSSRVKNSLGIKQENDFLVSMGNYIFFRDRLESFLKNYEGNDFAYDIIPKVKKQGGSLYAYPFDGYWKDVGKVGGYFKCNMDFLEKNPPIDWVKARTRTRLRHLPPARIAKGGRVENSILSKGDEIAQAEVVRSVLGYQVVVNKNCKLKNSIALGADRHQFFKGKVKDYNVTFIDEGAEIENAIIDKNANIGKEVKISPRFGSPEERREKLKEIGLKPYSEDGGIEGDFYISPENILVLGKRIREEKGKVVIPRGTKI